MHLLILTPFLFALGCAPAPTSASPVQPAEAAPASEPDIATKTAGTVISFGKHPGLRYDFNALSYLDDDGMLRDVALVGADPKTDLLSTTGFHPAHVRLSWIPHEGDRFRMTINAHGDYDIVKIEEEK